MRNLRDLTDGRNQCLVSSPVSTSTFCFDITALCVYNYKPSRLHVSLYVYPGMVNITDLHRMFQAGFAQVPVLCVLVLLQQLH